MPARHWIAGVFCAAAAGGCQSPAARDQAPLACARSFGDAPLLQLPRAHAPGKLSANKGSPYQFAVALPVGKNLQQQGRWTDLENGWSALALRITSPEATSLAVRFKPLHLPAGAQVWLCSADAKLRQGPYPPAGAESSELLTAIVTGDQALIEVLAPTAARDVVDARLQEAYAGFR